MQKAAVKVKSSTPAVHMNMQCENVVIDIQD